MKLEKRKTLGRHLSEIKATPPKFTEQGIVPRKDHSLLNCLDSGPNIPISGLGPKATKFGTQPKLLNVCTIQFSLNPRWTADCFLRRKLSR